MTDEQPARLGLTRTDKAVLVIGAPLLGAAIGFGLPYLASWVADLKWAPLKGPMSLIDSWRGPWLTISLLAVGALAGVAFVVIAFIDTLSVAITGAQATLRREDRSQTVLRADVSGVYLDGKDLVLLGRRTEELAREPLEGKPARAAEAFRSHGWPWLDGDPYAEVFRRWVPDLPELPAGAHALLAAREKALTGTKDAKDAAELRAELAKVGFVVRDDKHRQYWRALPEQTT